MLQPKVLQANQKGTKADKALKTRRSLRELENDYKNKKKAPLETLMRAWKGIKELPADDPRSFFNLGGYHGEPFRGAGWGNGAFWGGYCNHGNILFPTWHRIYCLKIEEALQSIPGCEDAMLPYWDETDEESLTQGIPWSLTVEKFELDGKMIDNPLRSFKFPLTITDNISSDKGAYTKPSGYETVRYPLSGLVGTDADKEKTKRHNAQYPDPATNAELLNKNVVAWLNNTERYPAPAKAGRLGIYEEYRSCLWAPNYTVFSNTTSAQQWNQVNDGKNTVMPLEQPHNDIHLSVGGFDVPFLGPDFSPIPDANGDMGENDTAALDPIFYFHHCNVDRMFWVWQKRTGNTDKLDIIDKYPGTNSSDAQGSTPGIASNQWLDLDTPLNPFVHNKTNKTYTSKDCINIEKQLGFTYSIGSLDVGREVKEYNAGAPSSTPVKKLAISKINKAPINGSFVIKASITVDGKKYPLGWHSVLSRWNTVGCANCGTHLEVKAFFDLPDLPAEKLDPANFHVEINGRGKASPALAAIVEQVQYKLEVR